MDARTMCATILVVFLLSSSLGTATATTGPGTGSAGKAADVGGELTRSIRGSPDGPARQSDSAPEIVVTEEYRLTPDRPGEIGVRWEFAFPDTVTEMETRVPEEARTVNTDGFDSPTDSDAFDAPAGGVYEWSGDGSTATIAFTLPANRTGIGGTPEAHSGRYRFVDAGDWALVERPRRPEIWYRYRRSEPGAGVEVTFRNRTDGPGVVGEAMVYLGESDTHRWRAHGQDFRLVVPERSTLVESRSAIVDSVSRAADQVRVGDRDGDVLLIAAPTSVSWAGEGLQRGDSDVYVLANQTVDEPDNVWLHEYVHTRQDGNWTETTEWFVEGSAEYYAALLTLQQDRIDFDAFREHLARGTRDRYDDVRLDDPHTWRSIAGDYVKGALVAGAIDRRIRSATDSTATLQSVVRSVNGHQRRFTQSDFLGAIEDAGGDSVARRAQTLIQTSATPGPWSVEEHRARFGTLPAIFRYDLPEPGSDGFRVQGPYRNGTLDRPVLVPGETLVLDVGVHNVGGAAGEYDLSLTVDGRVTATRSGRIDSDGSTTETVELPARESGAFTVGVGQTRATIAVRDLAAPRITSIRAEKTPVTPGEDVTMTANVTNPADRPAGGPVEITLDGDPIATRPVQLDPGESATVHATTTLTQTGTHRFGAGNLSVAVRVEERGLGETVGELGPGFGPVIAIVALALLAVLGPRIVSE